MEGNPGLLYHGPQAVKASRQSPLLAVCAHNRAILICLNNPIHRLNCAHINNTVPNKLCRNKRDLFNASIKLLLEFIRPEEDQSPLHNKSGMIC